MQRTGHRHWTRRRFLASGRGRSGGGRRGTGVEPPRGGRRSGPRRDHARPGDEPQLPRLDRHALGLREGEPQRRDEAVHGRGMPARQGGRRGAPLLRGRPGLRAGKRRLAQGDRPGRPPRRQPHLRPRQRAGDAARGHPVPVPAGPLADRGPDSGRGHPRQHSPDDRGDARRGSVSRRPASAPPAASPTGCGRRPDLREMLRAQGFGWVSSLYPRHPNTPAGEEPGAAVYDSIVRAQADAQPFVYPDGLVEVPMSPISDIGAFRNGRWRLECVLEGHRA